MGSQGGDAELFAALRSVPVERWDVLAAAFARAEGASGGWLAPSPDEGDDEAQPAPRLDEDARALVAALEPFVGAAGIEPGAVPDAVVDADLDELTDMTATAALRTVAAVLHAGKTDEGLLLSAFESGAMQTLTDRLLTARAA